MIYHINWKHGFLVNKHLETKLPLAFMSIYARFHCFPEILRGLFYFIFKTVKGSLMENKYHLEFWGSWLGVAC